MDSEDLWYLVWSSVFVILLLFVPTFICARKIISACRAGTPDKLKLVEYFVFLVFPVVGYFGLDAFRTSFELLDWRYLFPILAITIGCIVTYMVSRTRHHRMGPLFHALAPSILFTGALLALVQFIHFQPFIVFTVVLPHVISFLYAFVGFGLLSAAALLCTEMYVVLHRNKQQVMQLESRSEFLKKVLKVYFGKHALIAQLLTFPIFLVVLQLIFMLATLKPFSIIQVFIESHDGVFSRGECEQCKPASCYVCTIAAQGSPGLVRPVHLGMRGGDLIRVNRQLKVCKAFEEWLSEQLPRTHRVLRKSYDALQIQVDKWKQVKWIANTLYILVKPMEWGFLVALYFFDKEPEIRIGRQYLPAIPQSINPTS